MQLYFLAGNNVQFFSLLYKFRFVASDLATDVVVQVGEVKFFLHKVGFVLLFTINSIDHLACNQSA